VLACASPLSFARTPLAHTGPVVRDVSPLPGRAGLAVARARSACGCAAAGVVAAAAGVARTPALCVVRLLLLPLPS
jgi:hypothetical protein